MSSRTQEKNATFDALSPGTVAVECGPISMTISASERGAPRTDAATQGARCAEALLAGLSPYVHVAKQNIMGLTASPELPEVLNLMIAAARGTDDPTVTPMVAVAGSIADLVLGEVLAAGATTAVVNNGGDIALRVEPGRTIRVGIAADITTKQVICVLNVTAQSGIGGVCTSGLGGRSFTKGIASAAVAIASSAAVADAAATLLGNATLVDDPAVEQCPAEFIDADTDIMGHLVTVKVGPLRAEKVIKALQQGLALGKKWVDQGMLAGVVLVVQGQMASYPQQLALE